MKPQPARATKQGTLTPDDLRAIMHAIQSTPEWQFLNHLMMNCRTPEQRRQTQALARQVTPMLSRPAQPAIASRY